MRRARRQGIDFHLDIAPVNLIDLLLVLLIFFVTTTTFLHLRMIELTLPTSTTPQKAVPNTKDHVINIDASCTYFLDGVAVDDATLHTKLKAIATQDQKTHFRVGADETTPHRCFVVVLEQLQQANIDQIAILTERQKVTP